MFCDSMYLGNFKMKRAGKMERIIKKLFSICKNSRTFYSRYFTICNHLVNYCLYNVYVATPSKTGPFEKKHTQDVGPKIRPYIKFRLH
jgi:hypothetical protein